MSLQHLALDHDYENQATYSDEPPKADEIVIYKHRVSAFSGTDLEMILRVKGITHLVFFGIATSGIVLSTLRQAADLDFHCVVIADCCHDGDEEVHRVLTTKVFSRQATVVTTEMFIREMC
jgi:nicotinamidase-related amidase